MRFLLLGVVLAVSLAGCSGSPTAARVINETGTVRYQDLEGGFYGIIGDGGAHYDPTNLPAASQVEGLRVRFVAHTVDNGVSYHMWGTIIRIESIQALR